VRQPKFCVPGLRETLCVIRIEESRPVLKPQKHNWQTPTCPSVLGEPAKQSETTTFCCPMPWKCQLNRRTAIGCVARSMGNDRAVSVGPIRLGLYLRHAHSQHGLLQRRPSRALSLRSSWNLTEVAHTARLESN
jgi:hypothetical protein